VEHVDRLERENEMLRARLATIHRSKLWKAASFYWRLSDTIAAFQRRKR
jgi:hypothetical protein